jgi:hypothetical protein
VQLSWLSFDALNDVEVGYTLIKCSEDGVRDIRFEAEAHLTATGSFQFRQSAKARSACPVPTLQGTQPAV